MHCIQNVKVVQNQKCQKCSTTLDTWTQRVQTATDVTTKKITIKFAINYTYFHTEILDVYFIMQEASLTKVVKCDEHFTLPYKK